MSNKFLCNNVYNSDIIDTIINVGYTLTWKSVVLKLSESKKQTIVTLLEQFQQIFGERIKARRRELRLTQMELSEHLHISRTMLANIETGAQRTSVFLLARLAQTLKVSTEDLVPDMTEAEARFKQSRNVSLATENKPVLLSRELEALNISVSSGSTLEDALKEVRLQHEKNKPTQRGEEDD